MSRNVRLAVTGFFRPEDKLIATVESLSTSTSFLSRFRRGIDSGDDSLCRAAAHAMLVESPGRFTRAIKSRNDFALQVDHLAFGVDSQTGPCVVNH